MFLPNLQNGNNVKHSHASHIASRFWASGCSSLRLKNTFNSLVRYADRVNIRNGILDREIAWAERELSEILRMEGTNMIRVPLQKGATPQEQGLDED